MSPEKYTTSIENSADHIAPFDEQFTQNYNLYFKFDLSNPENKQKLLNHVAHTLQSNISTLFPDGDQLVSVSEINSHLPGVTGLSVDFTVNGDIDMELVNEIKESVESGELDLESFSAGSEIYNDMFEYGKFDVLKYIQKIATDVEFDTRFVASKVTPK